ncbi:MAG: GNAT family N-acetyltransferase [Nocardioidaceae bacterium]
MSEHRDRSWTTGAAEVESPAVHVASFTELASVVAYRLWRLRIAVFVVEQQCPYQELDGRDIEPTTRHVWTTVGDEPIGCLRILAEPDGAARIGRVCVRSDARGTGLAEVLMRAALNVVGDRASVLDAQTRLGRWYARFGYETSGAEFEEDGIPHLPHASPSRLTSAATGRQEKSMSNPSSGDGRKAAGAGCLGA